MSDVDEEIERTKRMLRRPRKGKTGGRSSLLSCGSTLVNLACSGSVEGAFKAGHYYFYVGDSMSGKTWLGMTTFAEACLNPAFDGHRLIYLPTEAGAQMDLAKFFGRRMNERIEFVELKNGLVEEFYFAMDDLLADGRPFVCVLDSQDSLSSEAEAEKFEERKRASRKGKSVSGSYGDSKAKVHSANVRRLIKPLERSGSILIVLNQTRDSFDLFQRSSYSGGRALRFYATIQLWSSVRRRIERTVRGKKRQVGIVAKVAVRKNRLTGRERTVEVPILHDHGVDDVGGMIDYLIDEGVWKKGSNGFVEAAGLGPEIKLRPEDMIRKIEEEELTDDLRALTQRTWDEVERACEVRRKRRYE